MKDQGTTDMDATGAPSLDIVVISLSGSSKRREMMAAQLDRQPHDWSFFDAHDRLAHPRLRYDAEAVRRSFGRRLSQQELAIYSSHYAVVTRFLEDSRSDYLLVFEDDAIFDTAVPLGKVMAYCKARDLHYLRLFGMYDASAVHLGYFYDRWLIRYRSSPAGLQCYMLSREGAERMARGCEEIDTAVDIAFDQFWKTGLPIYSLFPFPTIERFSPSSNQIGGDEPMGRLGRARLTGHRIGRRLTKIWCNLALIREDRRIRRLDDGFKQIWAEDMEPRR